MAEAYHYLLAVVILVPWAIASVAAEPDAGQTLQHSLIWVSSAPEGKQVYAVFRKTCELKERPQSAVMRLFADSRYILWINGNYVNRGPCRFDPIAPEYDTLDVTQFLQPGVNVIAALVHHYHDGKPLDDGTPFSGRIMRHVPGFTTMLEITDANGSKQVIPTDASWRVSTRNRFQPSPISWSSIPDRIDARRNTGDWAVAAFDDSKWEYAVPIDGKQWGPLRARHIPLLRETEVGPLTVVQWSKQKLEGEPKLASLLPLEMKAGDRLVFDAGQFAQAYSVLDFEAAEGSQVTLGYAQTFHDSGDVPGGYGGNVNQYTARAGRQTYVSGDTFGCKYVFLQVTSGRIRLLDAKMINRIYPFDVVGAFASNDAVLNDIWKLGVRTLQTCSEDAHVDCATRERAEWVADTAMIGYPIVRLTMAGPGIDGKPRWSDPRLFGNILRHIGQSVQPDGRVKAHHPSNRWDRHGYIEDFSCLWIQGLRAWYDHTNDLELVRDQWAAVTAQLKWFLDRRTERGLICAREFVFFDNPLAYQVCEGATLNAFVSRALVDAAELARQLGYVDQERHYAKASEEIRNAINVVLWDEASGTYHGGIKDGAQTPPTVYAATMCLYFDMVPADRRKRVEEWFFTHMDQERYWPYAYAFYFDILARMDSDIADRLALDLIHRLWTPMTRFETQTTWEAFKPEENCHQIGGAPTVYLSRHVLGVGLDGPIVRKRLLIEPHLADLTNVTGIVVTELGLVSVTWHRVMPDGIDWSVDIPSGVCATISLPAANNASTLIVDGAAIPLIKTSSRRVSFTVESGPHRGQLR